MEISDTVEFELWDLSQIVVLGILRRRWLVLVNSKALIVVSGPTCLSKKDFLLLK